MSSLQKEMSSSQIEISNKILEGRIQIVWGPPVIIFHVFNTFYSNFITLLKSHFSFNRVLVKHISLRCLPHGT
jgi:hypothetical protein